MTLEGKVAIVAGGGGGIGQGVAKAFGAEGAQVIPWDISEAGLKDTEDAIKAKGGKVLAMKVNVLKYEDTKAAAAQVLGKFGKVDILVVTVGGGKFGAFHFKDITPEYWHQQIDYNLTPVFNCCHVLVGPMMDRKYGKIVTFVTGFSGSAPIIGYQAGKAAVKSFSETLAADLAPFGINVNILTPGIVLTPLTVGYFNSFPGGDKVLEESKKRLPRGPNTPENVAKTVLHLCSDEANRISGQIIHLS